MINNSLEEKEEILVALVEQKHAKTVKASKNLAKLTCMISHKYKDNDFHLPWEIFSWEEKAVIKFMKGYGR